MKNTSVFTFLITSLLLIGCQESSSNNEGKQDNKEKTYLTVDMNTIPTPMEEYIKTDENIQIVFNSNISETTANSSDNIYLEENGTKITNVTTTVSLSKIVIDPAKNLDPFKEYTLVVTKNIQDINGNSLENELRYKFTPNAVEHKGYKYKMVKSPVTQRIWLDRNLGAYKVCEKSRSEIPNYGQFILSEENCFGDYYQWGRRADGHQVAVDNNISTPNKIKSSASNTKISGTYLGLTSNLRDISYFTSAGGNGDWIVSSGNKGQNTTTRILHWRNGSNTKNICPENFIVPTKKELENETILASGNNKISNYNDLQNNFLKLSLSGSRLSHNGDLSTDRGNYGIIWTSSAENGGATPSAYVLEISKTNGQFKTRGYVNGFPIRCIQVGLAEQID
ncbi:MAG: Ig-like domain-containing protein [Campylobacterales bacterium]|nr:Ig-like domain-containing protein [Campylobacterales bacterium]